MIEGFVYRLHTWISVNESVYHCSDIMIQGSKYLYYEAPEVSYRQEYQREPENQRIKMSQDNTRVQSKK